MKPHFQPHPQHQSQPQLQPQLQPQRQPQLQPQPNGSTAPQQAQQRAAAPAFKEDGHGVKQSIAPSLPTSTAPPNAQTPSPSVVHSRPTLPPSAATASDARQPAVSVPKEVSRPILSPLNNEQSQPKPSPSTQGQRQEHGQGQGQVQPVNGVKHATASGSAMGISPNTTHSQHLGQTPTAGQPQLGTDHINGREGSKPLEKNVPAAPSHARPEAAIPLSPNIPTPDASRPTEALSSPASTAQTGATPAVMDTSANTSPDHEPVHRPGLSSEAIQNGSQEALSAAPTLLAKNIQPEPAVKAKPVLGPVDGRFTNETANTLSRDLNSSIPKSQAKTESKPIPDTPVSAVPRISVKNTDQPTTVQSAQKAASESRRPNYEHANNVSMGANHLHRALQPTQTVANDQNRLPKSEVVKSFNVGPLTPSGDNAEPSQRTPPVASPAASRTELPPIVTPSRSNQKSVAEVLAEHPKPMPSEHVSSRRESHGGPITPVSQSFTKSHSRSLIRKTKPKHRSKISTVVFGKQSRIGSDAAKSLVHSRGRTGQAAVDDYFTPLFIHGFTVNSKWMKPLEQILHHAHKTVSTPDAFTPIFEQQACRVLRSVYGHQHSNKWSLRQPKRCPEPTRQPSHWDQLLKEMKWLRTDFREERKWKMAAARNLVYACAEWTRASPEDRKALQVNAFIPPLVKAQDPENQPTPDLIPSGQSESPMALEEEPHHNILETVAPSAIFALQENDIVFALQQSPATDRLLGELPMYGSPLATLQPDLVAPDYDPDAAWKRPVLPVSKYAEGEMVLSTTKPPQKRSRYQYAEEEDEDGDEVIFGSSGSKPPNMEPETTDVALFRPENKMIRDRLHAGHQFRPPNEYTMPFQTFYESRSYSQWTQSEDDELKSLVREYSYNWSLISSMLASKSMFVSGAERRTPWECFERWVMLEGLPNDMQKTQYFKLWQTRIEQAQQTIRQQNQNAIQQHAQQQQQAGANAPATPILRRRPSLPVKVERRRNQKHLTMIDAMRKLAKKRETTLHKQQQTAAQVAMRKQNEAPQPKVTTKTPREYSIMRWERDQAMAERLAERMAQHRQHQEAQRKVRNPLFSSSRLPNISNTLQQVMLQARAQQAQAAQMAASQSAGQRPPNNPQMAASHPHAALARANAPNQVPINGQARPRMPMHPTPNGAGSPGHVGGLVPPMQMNGSPQMQMPAVNGQSQMAMPNGQQPDVRLIMQAQRIQEQQRHSVQMRQQQSHQGSPGATPMQNSPQAMRAAALNSLNQKNYLNNAQAQAMMASMHSANGTGMSTPPGSGFSMSAGQSASPPPNTTLPQQTHQTYVSQLQHIENHLRSTNPNVPQEAIRHMARQLLQSRQNNMAQSAMNAAAGGQAQATAANGPHQYAALLRQQQQQQQAQAAAQAVHKEAEQRAQAAHAAQAIQAQHQRHTSGSATPTPTPPVPK